MSKQNRKGIMFIGPGAASQGGIAAVISNYAKTDFWAKHGCFRLSSTKDYHSKFLGAIADFFRICRFATAFWYPSRPAAVSIHASHSGSFYRKLPYILIARAYGSSVVLHIHPAAFITFYDRGNIARKGLIRLAGKLSDQIVCLSEETSEGLSHVFDQRKLRILGNPVDISIFQRPADSPRSTRPRILFLGWIVQAKGVYDLLAAVPIVLKQFPDALFTFAGNKEVDNLKRQISENRLGDSVEVLGWVSGQQKIELIHSAWMLVLPSYTEGLPNVILEAMASQLPIVTTPVGGIPSVLMDNETALFVEPGNVDSIAEAILSLLRDKEKSAAMALAAYDQARERYSLEAINRGLEGIYQRYC